MSYNTGRDVNRYLI